MRFRGNERRGEGMNGREGGREERRFLVSSLKPRVRVLIDRSLATGKNRKVNRLSRRDLDGMKSSMDTF